MEATLLCRHNGTGVVREIAVEIGVHLFIRVIRGRVRLDVVTPSSFQRSAEKLVGSMK
jgi:hypothetical protein